MSKVTKADLDRACRSFHDALAAKGAADNRMATVLVDAFERFVTPEMTDSLGGMASSFLERIIAENYDPKSATARITKSQYSLIGRATAIVLGRYVSYKACGLPFPKGESGESPISMKGFRAFTTSFDKLKRTAKAIKDAAEAAGIKVGRTTTARGSNGPKAKAWKGKFADQVRTAIRGYKQTELFDIGTLVASSIASLAHDPGHASHVRAAWQTFVETASEEIGVSRGASVGPSDPIREEANERAAKAAAKAEDPAVKAGQDAGAAASADAKAQREADEARAREALAKLGMAADQAAVNAMLEQMYAARANRQADAVAAKRKAKAKAPAKRAGRQPAKRAAA